MLDELIKDPKVKANQIMIDGFFDNSLNLKENLISDRGSNNLNDLINLFKKDDSYEKKDEGRRKPEKIKIIDIKNNQLRKFYDSFLKIYNSNIAEDVKKIQLIMLGAQAEYAVKRLGITRFGIFLKNRISIVTSKSKDEFKKNLDAFKLHFEALIGYFPK